MNATPRHHASDRAESAERHEMTALLPPPSVPDLTPDRERALRQAVLSEAADQRPATARPRLTARPPRERRLLVRFAVPALACAVAAGAVVAVNLSGTDDPAPDGTRVEAQQVPEATRLLNRVALAAAQSEPPAVRADQFVYVQSTVAYAGQSAGGGAVTLPPAHTRRVWLSADGSRPGLLREAGKPDSQLGSDAPVYTVDRPGATPSPSASGSGPSVTNPTHTYVASLPTDPDALLALIRQQTRGQGQDPDQRAFTAIGELLAETWAPPKVSAALYRAAGKIPGVTVVRAAKDAAGREGVAVARTAGDQQTQWVFDRNSHAYLGERTVSTRAGDAGPAGTVLGTSAVLAKAAVDRAGDAPRG
ncbi:CU044_5270 family protein [Streptomyces sp. NPDC057702]|uniref:CU044_5270 family protein n=1 Tax=unclassified Streptomyces TaxID=2593676 RepID=UPI0036C8C96F